MRRRIHDVSHHVALPCHLFPIGFAPAVVTSAPIASLAPAAESATAEAASAGWDMACRIVGECRFGAAIDREIGGMTVDPDDAIRTPNWTGPKQFAYVRYDPEVTQSSLNDMGLPDVNAGNIQVLDSIKFIPDIQRVGRTYAERSVRLAHLRNFV
jgi:uncharacterized protein